MCILILNKNDIENIFSMKDAINASKDALMLYSNNKTIIPLRINIDIKKHNANSLYMPGYVEEANALGLKIVSVFPNNTNKDLPVVVGSVILLDSSTGEVAALLDGTYITKLRTGAVSGAATDLLSSPQSKIFTLIGSGGQAESQLEAVLNVRDIELVKIHSKTKHKARDFAKKMSDKYGEKFGVRIIDIEDVDLAIEDADVITAITTSETAVFDGRKVKKGAHINGVGSYTPNMQELDEYIITNADKVYVDTEDGVLNEAGDFIIPIKNSSYKKENLKGELGQLILGQIKGRENDKEITIFKSTGTAVLDLVVSSRVYETALNKKVGTMIEM